MSMQTIEHQGYGVDLGDFQSTTENYNKVIANLINDDDLTDYINDNSSACCATTSVNANGFTYLVYIPAIIPVATNPRQVKTYTEAEAHDVIFKTIKDTIVNNHLTDDLADQKLTDDFFRELRKFINKNADYSHNNDWSDFV